MFPSHVDLEVHQAEPQLAALRREKAQQYLMQEYEALNQQHDLTRAAFSPWRTAVQAAFAVMVMMVTLFIVFASIVAITRA